MAKIGRNDPCPCGSGRKYKKCCLGKQSAASFSPARQFKISLMAEIEKIQAAAARGEEVVRELGVFILWANVAGDAWLMEIAESDAVQLSRAGEALQAPIDENPETIEINWSHTFAIRERELFLTAYDDRQEHSLQAAPTGRIHAALRRIRKKFSEEELNRVHVQPAAEGGD